VVIDVEQLTEVKEILGDKAKNLIEQYLLDTKILLSEIDVARATGQDDFISEIVHTMKSSSFQVGAHGVMEQATIIENFIHTHKGQLSAMHHQSRLDHLIGILRQYHGSYQDEIYEHL